MKSFKDILDQIDSDTCASLFLLSNPPPLIKMTDEEKRKAGLLRDRLVDIRGFVARAKTEPLPTPLLIQRWQEAKAVMLRSGVSSDDVMERVKLIDGTPVFKRRGSTWGANSLESKIVKIGYALACGFCSENGGQPTHQMVAMFSLAADVDRASRMPKKDITNITAGFEDGSAEDKAQKKLGDKYPNIQKAILSFF